MPGKSQFINISEIRSSTHAAKFRRLSICFAKQHKLCKFYHAFFATEKKRMIKTQFDNDYLYVEISRIQYTLVSLDQSLLDEQSRFNAALKIL